MPSEDGNTQARGRNDWRMVIGAVIALAVIVGFWCRSINLDPVVVIPEKSLPSPNAYDYYVKAGKAVVSRYEIGDALYPGENEWSIVRRTDLLKRNAAALKILREGEAYPCKQPTPYDFKPGVHIRDLARLLALDAMTKNELGDFRGGLDSAVQAIGLGQNLRHGAGLSGSLLGYACEGIGRPSAWDAAGHLDATEARSAARLMAHTCEERPEFADAMRQEKLQGQAEILRIVRTPGWRKELLGSAKTQEQIQDIMTQMAPTVGNMFRTDSRLSSVLFKIRTLTCSKRVTMNNYSRYMDACILESSKPYAAGTLELKPPGDPLSVLLAPDFYRKYFHSDAKNATQNALLTVFLALRAYQLEHGKYPDSLLELVPSYLSKIPEDPFALKGPLSYRRVGDDCVLYSVGPDGKDNGGQAIVYGEVGYIQRDDKGDVVAGVNTR